MSIQEQLSSIQERIHQVRTAEVTLQLVDANGKPIQNAAVEVQLTRHAFKFGANGFHLCSLPDPELQRLYDARFSALLNYATLPLYWGGYEISPGVTRAMQVQAMARWCQEHGIATKGHPLAWHEVFPKWAEALSYRQVLGLLEKRIQTIVADFKGLIDIWDVFNEATVSHRFENHIGRWIAHQGRTRAVEQALRWAHAANPAATLLYNDFNISPDFELLVEELLERGAPLHAIGIQSHMHQGTWTLERAWEVCDTYARFGLPLHFTELTVLSGMLKDRADNDWHTVRPHWPTTPHGEAAQAEYGEALYSLLFSHPAVEAVTWWDFADYHSWQGAPAGFVRADMSPKPLYERLSRLIHSEWRTHVQTATGEDGKARCRGFFGQHQVTARLSSGETLSGVFDLSREAGDRFIQVRMLNEPSG